MGKKKKKTNKQTKPKPPPPKKQTNKQNKNKQTNKTKQNKKKTVKTNPNHPPDNLQTKANAGLKPFSGNEHQHDRTLMLIRQPGCITHGCRLPNGIHGEFQNHDDQNSSLRRWCGSERFNSCLKLNIKRHEHRAMPLKPTRSNNHVNLHRLMV